ncbi:CpsB/CapC family capsule biosynthesis tyrosine phosphatase [Sulfurovum sp.]|uniref:tyrosine-protein phosphatase n=1 Tax=Sulfurovum sp. TaxID=1969726 RepID=UPI002600A6CB|nr:CpsB/CapC family capsule biosynthesis tyrosine phosphatase [Sulfurovum sp.]
MIFSFFHRRKKKTSKEAPQLFTDLHSHLIPGIDDGSQSMDESIALLKGIAELGYRKVITTPHIMSDSYKNTPHIIQTGLQALRKTAVNEEIDLRIDAAAEYYLDDGFLKLLEAGEMLSINGEYLLFETSYMSKPLQTEEMIFEISSAGYIPLMAHPERYRYIRDPLKEYGRFKELGVFFQVNLNSFGGHYGKSAKTLANFLRREGMIDFLGSDIHHQKQVESLGIVLQSEVYREIYENNIIQNNQL